MFDEDFTDVVSSFSVKGKPTHVVNQVIESEADVYRVPIGNGWLEGKLEGRIELCTMYGDFEVIPCEDKTKPAKRMTSKQAKQDINKRIH